MSKQPSTTAPFIQPEREGDRNKAVFPARLALRTQYEQDDTTPANDDLKSLKFMNKIAGTPAPSIVDHTADKPWRKVAPGYQNVELTDDDGTRHIHAVEDLVWSAFRGCPPEGHRVSFLDGNPANCYLDNLVLLSPGEANALDAVANVGQLPVSLRPDCGREQLRGLTFLDDGYVDPAFIGNGYAVVLWGMFECEPKKEWRFNFGLDLAAKATGKAVLSGADPSNASCKSSGDARYSQSRLGLSIEAVLAFGPLRSALFHHSTHNDLMNGLRGLRKLVVGELRKAVLSRDAVFKPKFAEWVAQKLPSPEALLDIARSKCVERKDDPAIAHLLGLSAFDDKPISA